jgi:two-component system, OmpR family, KDP operon response regulator KdpE
MNPSTVLVVEDSELQRLALELHLGQRGYRVLSAADGLGGLALLAGEAPDLVILDLHLPDIDGYEVCRRIRAVSTVPIIMLTAEAEEAQKVRGLRLGADDYVTKPFGVEELVARVEAVLRRRRPPEQARRAPYRNGELTIDLQRNRVLLGGQEVVLTPVEHRLLAVLARQAGRVLPQDELLSEVWGPGYAGDSELLHTAVRRLRRKLNDDPIQPRFVHNRRGLGYWLPAAEGI